MDVEIKLLDPEARIPIFAHTGDACADLHASKNTILPKNKVVLVPTGFSMAVPNGYEALVRPRSGLAAKHGIIVVNSPGTIDSGYRGEVKVILMNCGEKDYEVKIGDRIAQMAIRAVPRVNFVQVKELTSTERGEDGFGSTGT